MTWTTILTVGVTAASGGPFPPGYPVGASGFIEAASNPTGDSAGALSLDLYFGASICALANDRAAAPTQVLLALEGDFDATFIGTLTTPDGKTYSPAQAVWGQSIVGGEPVTTWIWKLAAGGVALVNGSVTIANSGDTLLVLAAESSASTQINLSWANNGPTPPTNYLLYRGYNSSLLAPTLYQTLSGSTLSYNDTGLAANAEYSYYVTATYADGTLEQSVTLNLFTPASGVSDTFNCSCTPAVPDGWTIDTLANLRVRVAISCGYASQAHNLPSGMKTFINEKLRTAQNQLFRQHFEKKTERMWAWQMEPNQRYYGLTEDMSGCGALDPLNITWVGFEDLNKAWYSLVCGIDPVLYTRAQISNGWPTHYEIRQCIEIFPAPLAAYTLWIKGAAVLTSFVNDTDITSIDSEAVYLLATGFVKQHYGQADGSSLVTQALNYTKQLVAGQHRTQRFVPRTRVQTSMTPPRFLPLG
jgi:hypothetical protein